MTLGSSPPLKEFAKQATAVGRTVGMFLSRPSDVPEWRANGASLFLLGTDHGFMLAGAAEMLKQTGRV